MKNLRTPPLLLGMALVFWGWETRLLAVGTILAVVFETARLVRVRWDFSQADLDRIWNLCMLLLVAALAYAALGEGGGLFEGSTGADSRRDVLTRSSRSVLLLFQWLPLTLTPMMLVQAFGRHELLEPSTFSWFLRRQRRNGTGQPAAGLNFSFPYLASILVGASACNDGRWFYPALAVLVGWALWSIRPRRFPIYLWSAALGGVIVLGLGGFQGIRELQRLLSNLDSMILSRFGAPRVDPKETRTALGAIGRLKLSGKIVLRVEPEGSPVPERLREASYNRFKSPYWFNSSGRHEFSGVLAEDDKDTWLLLARKLARKSVRLWRYLRPATTEEQATILALPHGVARLEECPVFSLQTNQFGVARVLGPRLLGFRACFDDGATFDAPPQGGDVELPVDPGEAAALTEVAERLKLNVRSPEEVLQTLSRFFLNEFSYTTWLGDSHVRATNRSPFAAFLLEKRTGHCEYFATATTLLLRKAGIPARYAIGYAVQERAGRGYVVRERHAHAWSLAWIGGAWREVDHTPASWAQLELKEASLWEPLRDAFSRFWFEFARWRSGLTGTQRYLLLLLLPPLGLILFRLFFRRQWSRVGRSRAGANNLFVRAGADSEFYQIELRLAEGGLERRPGETYARWLQRMDGQIPGGTARLFDLLTLHYRYRFDPAGLSDPQRQELRVGAQQWLASLAPSGGRGSRRVPG